MKLAENWFERKQVFNKIIALMKEIEASLYPLQCCLESIYFVDDKDKIESAVLCK